MGKRSKMKKILLGLLVTLPIAVATQASAFPGGMDTRTIDFAFAPDVIEIKGGHGHGRGGGHGWGLSDFERGEIGPDLFPTCLMGLEGLVSRPPSRWRFNERIKVKNPKHPAMVAARIFTDEAVS
jgi:hypothetical protein